MAGFQSLPGFRDFYPEEFSRRQHIFRVWRQAASTFGFQEYDAPVLESLDLYKTKSGDEIACVIIEPVVGNMNLIVPKMEFLQTMRALCTKHATVLIFDEVMTGFRVHLGGAQAVF